MQKLSSLEKKYLKQDATGDLVSGPYPDPLSINGYGRPPWFYYSRTNHENQRRPRASSGRNILKIGGVWTAFSGGRKPKGFEKGGE